MLNAMLVRVAYADSDITQPCINPKVTANQDHLVADHRAVILRAIDRPTDDHHLGYRHIGRSIVQDAHPGHPGRLPGRHLGRLPGCRPVRLNELLPESLRERLQNANLGLPNQRYSNQAHHPVLNVTSKDYLRRRL
jgi:hypothetical protein